MSVDFGIFALILLPLSVLLVPLAVWAALVIKVAIHIRRMSWIAVRPRLQRPEAADLSRGMHVLLGRLAAALRAAGFEPLESVHAPGYSGFGAWTQVLYVNPATGERASFLSRAVAQSTGGLQLFLATEYPPHEPVVTGLPHGPLRTDEDLAPTLTDLIARHHEAVRRACAEWQLDVAAGLPVGVAPNRDEAMHWLERKVVMVAEDEATRLGYRIDPAGERYVAPWPLVLRVAATRMLPWKRRRPVARGFEAIPAAPSAREHDAAPTP
jgi:hypothetical protein